MVISNKSVLITGNTGFVGQHASTYLRSLHLEVKGVNRNPRADEFSYDQVFDGEVSAKYWIHLAGKAHDVSGKSDAAAYEKVNFELSCRLFDAFLASEDAEIFVFMSSVKAAADTVEGVLTEEAEAKPATAYGISKRKAEIYLLQNCAPNKKVYILRPCIIHGPGNKGNLNLLYKFVKLGLPYPLGAYENQRSFLGIDNLCYIIGTLLSSAAPSGIYQLADDETVSTNELLGLIAESLGKKPKLLMLPKFMIANFAKLGDYFFLPLNSDRLKKLTESYIVSNHKIKTVLGIALPTTTKQGLRHTLAHFNNA